VRLLAGEGELVMETGEKGKQERVPLISGLDGVEFSILRKGKNLPYGIGVACFRGQNSYHTLSVFSTFPVTGGLP
jgi:hypothetical protein